MCQFNWDETFVVWLVMNPRKDTLWAQHGNPHWTLDRPRRQKFLQQHHPGKYFSCILAYSHFSQRRQRSKFFIPFLIFLHWHLTLAFVTHAYAEKSTHRQNYAVDFMDFHAKISPPLYLPTIAQIALEMKYIYFTSINFPSAKLGISWWQGESNPGNTRSSTVDNVIRFHVLMSCT